MSRPGASPCSPTCFGRHNLPLSAEDTGRTMGRTVTLHAATGVVTVRVAGGQEKEL